MKKANLLRLSRPRFFRSQSGLTLVELMVVVIIIGIFVIRIYKVVFVRIIFIPS